MNKKLFSALFLACLLTACAEEQRGTADFVFTNARVYTVDESQPWAEAVAVKGNEIVYEASGDQ